MNDANLLHAWQTLTSNCAERKETRTGKSCPLYRICKHKDCETQTAEQSNAIRQAMLAGTPVELDGMQFAYIYGYCLRRYLNGKPGLHREVEIMDVNTNSILTTDPKRITILEEGGEVE